MTTSAVHLANHLIHQRSPKEIISCIGKFFVTVTKAEFPLRTVSLLFSENSKSRATAGDRFNNDKFSSCSIGNITQVLQRKRKCFVSSDAPICGNQIVDGGEEECDCGFKEDCDALGDKCCYPADHEEKSKRCKRKTDPRTRRKYECSPSEGPCCTGDTCSFLGSSTICSNELDCTFEQACNGKSPKCPVPKAGFQTTVSSLTVQSLGQSEMSISWKTNLRLKKIILIVTKIQWFVTKDNVHSQPVFIIMGL